MDEKLFDLKLFDGQGPQSGLEREIIVAYLREKGYTLSDIEKMPVEEARALMKAACRHATLVLAQIEARAKFVKEIKLSD